MRTMAYLHPTADHCVTTAPRGYDNPRELVLRSEALTEIRSLLDKLADSRTWLEDIRSKKLDGSEPELDNHLASVNAVLLEWGR